MPRTRKTVLSRARGKKEIKGRREKGRGIKGGHSKKKNLFFERLSRRTRNGNAGHVDGLPCGN